MAVSQEQFDLLAAEVRHLRDRQEILDCINIYGRGLDRLDTEPLWAAFHPDGVDNHGPFTGNVEAFVPFAIECESSFARTHHGVSSHNCEIDGDTAHAESYVHFFVLMRDRPVIGAGGGRYIDRLERRDGRWAIVVRRLIMDWTFEVPSSQWLGTEWDQFPPRRDRDDFAYHRPLTEP